MWDAGILECISKSKQVQILLNHDINGKGDVNACVQLIHREETRERTRKEKLEAFCLFSCAVHETKATKKIGMYLPLPNN